MRCTDRGVHPGLPAHQQPCAGQPAQRPGSWLRAPSLKHSSSEQGNPGPTRKYSRPLEGERLKWSAATARRDLRCFSSSAVARAWLAASSAPASALAWGLSSSPAASPAPSAGCTRFRLAPLARACALAWALSGSPAARPAVRVWGSGQAGRLLSACLCLGVGAVQLSGRRPKLSQGFRL